MCIERSGGRQRGVSLVELIVFIVIVGVGVAGLVATMNSSVRFSADPMRSKQMLAIAEALLNEVLHQPFTWCDPDDAAASTAQSYTDCATPQNTGTFNGTESRLAGTFDNVSDYGNYSMTNVTDASGSYAMTGYTASVAIAPVGTAMGLADNTAALSVTVTVRFDAGGVADLLLTGYRFRYAPRT